MSALATMVSCTTKQSTTNETTQTKSLIVYYSQTGATEQVANILKQETGADMELISAVKPYDGDFQQTIARCQEEMAAGTMPELNAMQKSVADYDTIYLCYPVWFGTYASPMGSFIQNTDLKGKVVIPCCTFGSGGLNTSSDNLKAAQPNATIIPGYGVRNARIAAAASEVKQFLVNAGIVAGQKVVLPEFSEQKAVTPADTEVFNAACSSYSMPLGNPVTVGSRSIENGTEYLFTVDSNGASAQIYVNAIEGQTPEFTQVVR